MFLYPDNDPISVKDYTKYRSDVTKSQYRNASPEILKEKLKFLDSYDFKQYAYIRERYLLDSAQYHVFCEMVTNCARFNNTKRFSSLLMEFMKSYLDSHSVSDSDISQIKNMLATINGEH